MRVHIIGAGLAGLAAAVHLTKQGTMVRVYEAAPRAGGRCRSHHDPQLGCVIDNGNHLLMSGNRDAMAYVDAIGARDRLAGPVEASYPFLDVTTGTRWTLRPSSGRIPWWIFDADRRVPGSTAASYLSALRLLRARQNETVADVIAPGTKLYRNFWEPFTVAALNTAPEQAAAVLMRSVLIETLLKGAKACRPLVASTSLAEALVDPALAFLRRAGGEIRLGCRVRALQFAEARVTAIETDDEAITMEQDDFVILTTPAWIAETLVPGLKAPPPGEAIVNVHYRLPRVPNALGEVKIVGIIGGVAQWVFFRGDLASVTISAAGPVANESAEAIATTCWRDVALALGDTAMAEPPARVIKERRATIAQTPAANTLRPGTATRYVNLFLAGDWTATGLPATIEGAVRSGMRAADAGSRARRSRSGQAVFRGGSG